MEEENSGSRYEFEQIVSDEIVKKRLAQAKEAWEKIKGKGVPLPDEVYDAIYRGMSRSDK